MNVERRQGRILCSGDINVCGGPQHLITAEILCNIESKLIALWLKLK